MDANPEDRREEELLPWLLAYDDALAAGFSPQQARESTTQASRFRNGNSRSGHPQSGPAQEELKDYCSILELLEATWPRRRSEAAEASDPQGAPSQIGRFQIIKELGRGGFGIVYLAFDPKLGRRVALKLPRCEVLFTSSLRSRFLREAQATAALDHPHIAPLFETGEIGDACYLVSPYCAGGTVADYTAKQSDAIPVRQAAHLVMRLADAVHYAHTRGVLHRDVKPANVLLEPKSHADGQTAGELPFIPRLTDFGLARLLESDGEEATSLGHHHRPQRGSLATCSGAMLGTPRYMAPEQIEGLAAAIGPATDVYGLGTLLYELLAGEPPFSGGSKADALRRVLLEDPLPPRRLRREVPADLEAICLKCLEKHPPRRYASADQLRADLQRFLSGEATLARPLSLRQQTTRWIRREPTRASLIATVAATLCGIVVGLSAYNARLGAYAAALQSSLDREFAQTEVANEQRALAEQRELEARGHAYVSDMWRARRMWSEGEDYRISDLLRHSSPQPGQSDLREFAWRYLWTLGTNLSDLRGHTGYVHGVRFSPDGKLCASWSSDSTDRSIRLWHVGSRSEQLMVKTAGNPRAVAFSADGRYFVSLDDQGHLCNWDVTTGRKTASRLEPELQSQPSQQLPQLAFSRDGRLLAYAATIGKDGTRIDRLQIDTEGSLRLLDLRSGEVRTLFVPGRQHPSALAFSDDASLLAAAWHADTLEDSVQVLRVATGEVIQTFSEREHVINDLGFSADGSQLAAGTTSTPGKIRLWDLTTGRLETLRDEGSGARVSLAFSPHGDLIASGRDDAPEVLPSEPVRIWSTRTGTFSAGPVTTGDRVLDLAFSPDGRLLAVAGSNGLLRLWDTHPHSGFSALPAHSGEAWRVAFSPDSSLLISAGDDHMAKVWDVQSGMLKATLAGHQSLVSAVAATADGRALATAGFDGAIKLWDLPSGTQRQSLEGHDAPVRSLAFRHDEEVMASAADDGMIKLWDLRSGGLRGSLLGHSNKIRSVVFQPASDFLIAADNDGFVKLWDTESNALVNSWQHALEVQSLAITPDGSLLAAGSKEGPIRLYRMPGAELSLVLPGTVRGARALAFSPDGRTLASGGEDAAVTLWHVSTGQELLSLPGVSAQVNDLAFAPDGQTLAAATHDGAVTLWRAPRVE